MKKLILLLAVLPMLSLVSCKTLVYSHKEAMETYKTKQDVLKTFGLPAQKKEGQDITEWVYDFTNISTKPVKGNGTPSYVSANTATVTVSQFANYAKYVKFTIDPQGNVVKWESHGVDLGKREANTVGTILLILVGAVLILAVIVSASGVVGFSGY